ncbi:gluconate 2-dehydrogenase subunit 3 family protein [Steroidobacter sp. S1-65]|uniref:Gluconate 2-dehydrogenase subunit 3 family protein n=1 Tax=Steroidobacter gossypii TaxID=2805490 RepID=A0ABS1X0A1_9GAMM|nr:gluconate 2-dehydrogenase subunit 3 family protein [Steroidobacter gossypii]MBM0106642.1 gluconate 2-dehydrogenase subunit 3 family protein [Steroidobacter gossypii]
MSKENDAEPKIVNRRAWLKLFGAGAASGVLPLGSAAAEDSAVAGHHATHAPAVPVDEQVPVYEFLNGDEAAFVEAAVDTLIPADDVGPGALELGVAVFIDRQLNSGYGRGDRMYLQGPFMEGTPEQGYQLRMTPSELFRNGILDVNAYLRAKYKRPFDALTNEDRIAVMTQLETGQIELPTVPTAIFFNLLYDLTMQGFFADPLYGGNKGKASWKMIGFPGIGAMYADKIEAWRNKKYMTEPMSIQDLL